MDAEKGNMFEEKFRAEVAFLLNEQQRTQQ